MKLSEYIRTEIEKGRRSFDIGVNQDMTTDDNSPTRIRFKVKCQNE